MGREGSEQVVRGPDPTEEAYCGIGSDRERTEFVVLEAPLEERESGGRKGRSKRCCEGGRRKRG